MRNWHFSNDLYMCLRVSRVRVLWCSTRWHDEPQITPWWVQGFNNGLSCHPVGDPLICWWEFTVNLGLFRRVAIITHCYISVLLFHEKKCTKRAWQSGVSIIIIIYSFFRWLTLCLKSFFDCVFVNNARIGCILPHHYNQLSYVYAITYSFRLKHH